MSDRETEKTFPHQESPILDQTLLRGCGDVDQIAQVFPLPTDDPYQLFQQLWYVERLYGRPLYLQDGGKSMDDDQFDASQRYQATLDEHGRFSWATQYTGILPNNISIVDLMATKPDFDTIYQKVKKFAQRVSGIVDLQMNYTANDPARQEERQIRISNMEARLARLWTFLIQDIRADFIGICVFDSYNLRAQILHRLVLVNEDMLPLPQGEPRRNTIDYAITQQPILYDQIIEAVERGCEDQVELKLREELAVWLMSKVQEGVGMQVGQEEERLFPGEVDESAPATVFEFGGETRSTVHVITVPLSVMRPTREGKSSFHLRTVTRDGDGKIKKMKVAVTEQPREGGSTKIVQINLRPPNRELLNEPPDIRRHLDPYFPNTPWERWRFVRRIEKPRVGLELVDLVESLAGRQFFVTTSGFLGIANRGTRGA